MDKLSQLGVVGAGGFLGAIARYGLSGLAYRWGAFTGFPHGTLLVNVANGKPVGPNRPTSVVTTRRSAAPTAPPAAAKRT